MRLSNLTTRLNIRAISIISVFMLVFAIYYQWIAFEERNARVRQIAELFAEHLERTIPANLLVENNEGQRAIRDNLEEQILSTNSRVQPVLNNVFMSPHIAKFGVYSSRLQRIVAIGPELDKTLLLNTEPKMFSDMFQTETAKVGKQNQSVLWYGSQIFYAVRPIKFNNEITGCVFVCINLDKVKEEALLTLQKSLFGGVIALLIVIMLFQEIFIRLKKELSLFADATVAGRGRDFESKISELNPILRYISEQTDRMARLDRLNIIGEMAASIGHEVRNPMTTVRGFLQYLGNKQAFEAYKSQFVLMITELDRANDIISEFLSLAKNKAMNFQQGDLNTIIREVAPLLEADALRHNCQIEMALSDVPVLSLDKSSIRQLILNIVRNGIEAMPQGGTLKISTCIYTDKVLLSFADEGTGIACEDINKLGTPFFTTKENGVGLGLAVCYRIVQRHNAIMSVKSKQGQGTKFTIAFNPKK